MSNWYARDITKLGGGWQAKDITSLPPSSIGYIKVWIGSSWELKPMKYWNGTSWIQKPLMRWSGTSWIATS